MKKLFTLIAMSMLTMSLYAADDAEAVAGTYVVHADVNFLYVSRYNYVYTDDTVTVTANGDGTVEVAYVNDTWGTYTLTAATVTAADDGSYSIAGEGTCAMASHSGGTSEYYCEGELTIADGAVSEGTFTVEAVMGGTVVTYASGDAPAFEIGAGDHRGYAEVMFAYISTPMCNAYDTLTVTVAGTDVLDISYTNPTWGEYTVDSALVTANDDGSYSIEGTGTGAMALHSGGTSEYYCELSATIDAAGTVEATFYMEAVMGGTSVVFYEGSAPAYAVAGEYIGDLTGVFAYGSLDAEGDTVVIDWTDTSNVSVELNDSTWGYFLVEEAPVTETDSTYVIIGTGTVAMDNHSGGTNDYAFDFEGTVSSDLSTYTFVYTLEIMGGTTITVSNVTSDEETGIANVTVRTAAAGSDAIYDLSGRRVSDTYRGVVIRNGKKYIK